MGGSKVINEVVAHICLTVGQPYPWTHPATFSLVSKYTILWTYSVVSNIDFWTDRKKAIVSNQKHYHKSKMMEDSQVVVLTISPVWLLQTLDGSWRMKSTATGLSKKPHNSCCADCGIFTRRGSYSLENMS